MGKKRQAAFDEGRIQGHSVRFERIRVHLERELAGIRERRAHAMWQALPGQLTKVDAFGYDSAETTLLNLAKVSGFTIHDISP